MHYGGEQPRGRRASADGHFGRERPAASGPTPPPRLPVTPVVPLAAAKQPRKLSWKMTVAIIAVLLLAAAGYWFFLREQPPIPLAVTSQASFAVFYPADRHILSVKKGSALYDRTTGTLRFAASAPDGLQVSFSEQATPGSFVDVPQVYSSLLASLQNYSSFDSINGSVALTLPKEFNGGQSAVMNSKGTLLFARPSRNLTEDQWRRIFNSLHTVH